MLRFDRFNFDKPTYYKCRFCVHMNTHTFTINKFHGKLNRLSLWGTAMCFWDITHTHFMLWILITCIHFFFFFIIFTLCSAQDLSDILGWEQSTFPFSAIGQTGAPSHCGRGWRGISPAVWQWAYKRDGKKNVCNNFVFIDHKYNACICGLYTVCKTKYYLPKNSLVTNVFRLQSSSMEKFVTQAIVESAEEGWCTPMRMQHSETFHFIVPVHQQFCFVAINTDQNHILHDSAHIAPKQLVGYSICEELQ